MSFGPDHPLASRRRAPAFRPSFTLAVVYLLAFFFLFAFLLILPELLAVLRDVEPGPEQERVAQQVAREAFAPRAPYAVLLALASVGLGSYLRVLPGLRRP
jgi:hypothetical protein